MSITPPYVGRFAPSPSGDLHFGSLVAALASYLDAHHHHGKWLLRMEDIDPPREVAGASDEILRTLETFGLHWHGSVMYQSQRHEYYQHHLELISQQQASYGCDCTRRMIKNTGGLYNGYCLNKTAAQLTSPHAIRFNNQHGISQFNDRVQGLITVSNTFADEDFIVKRRDGLYAYQLVVVLDDIAQGITDVVRGSDLLEVTTRQMTLYQYWELPFARYLHLPLAMGDNGLKLSKQNHALALNKQQPKQQLLNALLFLGQKTLPQYQDFSVEQLLEVASLQWQINHIPKQVQISAI